MPSAGTALRHSIATVGVASAGIVIGEELLRFPDLRASIVKELFHAFGVAGQYPGGAGIPRIDREEAALEASQVERGRQAGRSAPMIRQSRGSSRSTA
jgi:hypothetical protein